MKQKLLLLHLIFPFLLFSQQLFLDKDSFNTQEDIIVNYTDIPFGKKVWIGIIQQNENGNINALLHFEYFKEHYNGSINLGKITTVGRYYIATYLEESHEEIGNRLYISIRNSIFEETRSTKEIELTFGPTPVKDMLTISANKVIKSVEIYNVIGKTIKKETFEKASININLSIQPPGIYIVNVAFENGKTKTFRCIK